MGDLKGVSVVLEGEHKVVKCWRIMFRHTQGGGEGGTQTACSETESR